MNPLIKNPQTGFLEANNDHNSFTSERKVEFLRLAHEYIDRFSRFPSIHAICKQIGVPIRTFDYHKQHDEVFRAAWHEITSVLKYVYASNIAEKADSKNGVIAAFGMMRYLETGSFIPQVNINSNSNIASDKRVNEAIIVDVEAEVDVNDSVSTTNIQNNSGNSGASA